MSALDRDKARVVVQYARNLPLADMDAIVDRLEACVIPDAVLAMGYHEAVDEAAGSYVDRAVAAEAKLARIEAILEEPFPPNSFYINGMPDQYTALAEFYDEDFANSLRAILRDEA
jgi:hypothetical protein